MLLWVFIPAMFFSSCVDDKYLIAPAAIPDQSFVEEFDTFQLLLTGWKLINVSEPKGSDIWQQGGSVAPWFEAYSSQGTYAEFHGGGLYFHIGSKCHYQQLAGFARGNYAKRGYYYILYKRRIVLRWC